MDSDTQKVRLTQMVKAAGCAAKLFPNILSDALRDIDWLQNENVLVGFEGRDDAGVFKISDELALIHTTDFFTPVVDDPYTFGQIAATNALSDVYAMGGTPVSALNIVAFPQTEDVSILKDILRGGADKTREANTVIIGGHSIDIPNIAYGLAVTGTIDPNKIKGNNSALPGDVLIITKALGTGILNNAVKFTALSGHRLNALLSSMLRLNKNASICMQKYDANACTDITGFGLAGHAMQLAKASKAVLRFRAADIPILEGVYEAIDANMMTRGDKSNREYTQHSVKTHGIVDKAIDHLIYDPQTSGGLLISVPEKNSVQLIQELRNSGDEVSAIVGEVLPAMNDEEIGDIILSYE